MCIGTRSGGRQDTVPATRGDRGKRGGGRKKRKEEMHILAFNFAK
jgi:hypothetical protein